MRGWGSSFVLAAVGALLLWVGVMQFEGAYLPETGEVSGKVARVVPADGRYAVMFAGRDERFVVTSPSLPHPTVQALADAASVSVIYDARDYGHASRAIVGLSVDGHVYFSPVTYQTVSALLALVLLVPGALMFGIGASALHRVRRGGGDISVDEPALTQALIIPFPRRALSDV